MISLLFFHLAVYLHWRKCPTQTGRSHTTLSNFRALSDSYRLHVYPYIVPFMLPIAQISLTASVYTTIATCIDRYVAICRPVTMGCWRNENSASYYLICVTLLFSCAYNISRFFEYRLEWITIFDSK